MRTHSARIFSVFLLALTLLFSGCGNADTEKPLTQFLDTMLTAPAPTVASAMETATSDEDLASFSDAVTALLGDDVADEAKDSFVANRINPLQSVLLTSAKDCSTVPTSITLSEPTVSNDQERCYPYTAQLTVTTPDGVYENCTVSGQLRVDQDGKVLSITMDFSDALCDALTGFQDPAVSGTEASAAPDEEALTEEQQALLELAGGEISSSVSATPSYTVSDGVLYDHDLPVDTAITELDLTGSRFADYSFLSDFSELQILTLTKSAIADLTPLSNCTNLTCLALNQCETISDLSPLAALTQLETLFLTNTTYDFDLSPLAELDALRTLQLNFSAVTDISPLAQLTGLEHLFLWGTDIRDFSALHAMTGLVELELMQTAFSDLNCLEGLDSLSFLSISQTDVTDFSVLLEAEFPALQTLYCDADTETMSLLREKYPDCVIE